jgi:hypothetical protein
MEASASRDALLRMKFRREDGIMSLKLSQNGIFLK